MELTNAEKSLYNVYLKVSRSIKGKPYSYRKDFNDFEDRNAILIHRIQTMLYKYPHIDPEDYFKAPYIIYPDQDHFSLDYYVGMGAINAFTLYMKKIQELPPDDNIQLEQIKKSLKFIGKYCIEHKIPLDLYAEYKTGVTYDWMKHLKAYKVSVYALMEFDNILKAISDTPEDERELFLGDAGKYFLGYKAKYIQSCFAKHLVREGIEKIKKVLNSDIA